MNYYTVEVEIDGEIKKIKIDKYISNDKKFDIVFLFKQFIFQLKEKNMLHFSNGQYDYIITTLIIVFCTDLFRDYNLTLQEITANYRYLMEKQILHQIIHVFLEEKKLHRDVLEIKKNCEEVLNNNKNLVNKKNKNKDYILYNMKKGENIMRILSNKEIDYLYTKISGKKSEVDKLLDEYNDAKVLLEMFGDSKYKAQMTRIKKKLKEIAERG
jgi:hypothetical protein